jgi:hypothetical protein
MWVILHGLELMGFNDASCRIASAWASIHATVGARPEPEYAWCYPKSLLRQIAADALAGTREIHSRILQDTEKCTVAAKLNSAWDKFWSDPAGFPKWEQQEVELLFQAPAVSGTVQ